MNNNDLNEIINQLKQIDYSPITNILILYITNKTIDSYTFHKDFRPKNSKKINLPPELTSKHSNIDYNQIMAKQFGNSIINFANIILNKFPKEDLTIFYNNINNLKTSSKNYWLKNFFFQKYTSATYNIPKNKILVDKKDYTDSIYHELFHMASSLQKDQIYYSGFSQTSKILGKISIGNAINEGYTELLNDRYFNNTPKTKNYYDTKNYEGSYPLEVYIAYKLEQIIEQNKMEKLYLNANLPGLINELKKYSTEEEIMQFITSADFLHEHINKHFYTPNSKKMIIKSFYNIGNFLAKAYTNKLKQQLDNNLITKEEAEQQLSSYLDSLSHNGTYYEKGYFYPEDGKEYYSFISSNNKEQYSQIISNKQNIPKRK